LNVFVNNWPRLVFCANFPDYIMPLFILGSDTHSLMEERMLAILIRAVHSEKQAGYSERALAILQALVEYNLYTPRSLIKTDTNLKSSGTRGKPAPQPITTEAKLAFFQAFWDSEKPRFGENVCEDSF